ncbi:MAG: hypothetical protein AAGD00_08930 [Planctomycetota bacterium]
MRHRPKTPIAALAVGLLVGVAQATPTPSDAMAAYDVVRVWVDAGDVPSEPERGGALDPPGTSGVCVTLRFAGRTAGRGVSFEGEGRDLWIAARKAWVDAIGDLPAGDDAMRPERLALMRPLVQIDIQFAGEPTPLFGDTIPEVAGSVRPGLDGVASRVGARTEALFPGTMLAIGMSPSEALLNTLGAVGMPAPTSLDELRERDGLALLRFEVTHLAQAAPESPPVFLHRGGRVIGLGEVNTASLTDAANGLASHLVSRVRAERDSPTMTGDIRVGTGHRVSALLADRSQAVAAFALLRFTRTPGADPVLAQRADRDARRILASLVRDAGEPIDRDVAAAWLIAFEELRLTARWGRGRAQADQSERDALRAFGVRAAEVLLADAPGDVPAPARAFEVYGLARVGVFEEDARPEVLEAAGARIAELLRQTERDQLVALMPWLGWAVLETSPAGAGVAPAVALRELRRMVWAFRIDETELGDDVLGGISFSRGRGALATWQSLKPLAFLATMLGDARLTEPASKTEQLAELRRSLRFVLQLTVRERETHLARDPAAVLGSARPAPWDFTASADASALALLTICEALRSIAR